MHSLIKSKTILNLDKIGFIKQLNLSLLVVTLYFLLMISSVFFSQTYKTPLPVINLFAVLLLVASVFPILIIAFLVIGFLKRKSSSTLSYTLALLVYVVLIAQPTHHPFRNIYINTERVNFLLNESHYISEINKIKPDSNGKKYMEFDERNLDGSFVLYDESDSVLNSKSKAEGVFWTTWGSRNDASNGRCILEVIPLKSHFYYVSLNESQC